MKIRQYLLLLIVVIETGCGINQSSPAITLPIATIPDIVRHTAFSANVRPGPEWAKQPGISVGYIHSTERDLPPGERTQNDEYVLADGESFNPLLLLKSKEPTVALISVLVDYQQVSFTLDGKFGLLHEVSIESGSDWEIPFQVSLVEPGWHDVIVLAFADPYNASLDASYRSTVGMQMVGKRAVVFVGDSTTPARIMNEPVVGSPVPEAVAYGMNVAFAPADDLSQHPSERLLYVGEGIADGNMPYRLWFSNMQGEAGSNYAAVVFHNYHQILVNDKDVILFHLEPGQEIVFHASLLLSSTVGVDQLQAIFVFDPYKSLLQGEVRAPFVFASDRTVIAAMEPK